MGGPSEQTTNLTRSMVVGDERIIARDSAGSDVDPITVDGTAYVLTSVRDITKASAATAELRALVDELREPNNAFDSPWRARPPG